MADLELIAVILIVVLAAAHVLRQSIRVWAGNERGACGGGCGCARTAARGASGLIELKVRVRGSK